MNKAVWLSMLSLLLLAGCSFSPTSYQSLGYQGGYDELRLGEDMYRVTFQGNGRSSANRAVDFALLRSAELTLNAGYRYFVVVRGKSSKNTQTYKTSSSSYTVGDAQHSGNQVSGYKQTFKSGGKRYKVTYPSRSNTIVMYKERPKRRRIVFDAAFLVDSIAEKYHVRMEGR